MHCELYNEERLTLISSVMKSYRLHNCTNSQMGLRCAYLPSSKYLCTSKSQYSQSYGSFSGCHKNWFLSDPAATCHQWVNLSTDVYQELLPRDHLDVKKIVKNYHHHHHTNSIGPNWGVKFIATNVIVNRSNCGCIVTILIPLFKNFITIRTFSKMPSVISSAGVHFRYHTVNLYMGSHFQQSIFSLASFLWKVLCP